MLRSIKEFHFVPDLSLTSSAAYFLQGMVFAGAFLLFIMEPLVGRLSAPYFGGAVQVWLTSMMFFQAMLLAGYLYAYLFARRLGRWHLIILFLPIINLPLKIASEYAPELPILTLLSLLLTHIALPFVVLSTTAIVAQLWLAHSDLVQAHNPYPLYAASNAGSLIALLGYPFLVEPFLGLRAQSLLWTVGYLVYILLVLITWYSLHPDLKTDSGRLENKVEPAIVKAPKVSDYCWWLWLSFLPSGFLLAVTNFIASEVGSFPLIWILPLSLYLGSFIITFRTEGGVPRLLLVLSPMILLLGMILYLVPSLSYFQLAVNLLMFFIVCLYANGELYERRPSVGYLTNYYLTIAFGGWLGGIFVSLIAPRVFSGLFEYPLLLLLLCLTIAWTQGSYFIAFWRQARPFLRLALALASGVLLGLLMWAGKKNIESYAKEIYSHRSFYGIYRVVDMPPGDDAPQGFRSLFHGRTKHGGEYLDQELHGKPTTYYCSGGAVGDVFRLVPSPRHIAVVGLGVGTVSAYTKSNDAITFIEIDPANEAIARAFFSYLNNSKGSVHIISGDGRLSLHEIAKTHPKYHLIVIDAFSGDGIPTHLLTREAIQIYLNCLTEDGLLLFHISNRYYNLNSVIKATSKDLDLFGCMNIRSARTNLKKYDYSPACVVLAKSFEPLRPLLNHDWIPFGAEDGLKTALPWTDDYINIIDPLLANITEYHSLKRK
jgi:hypothetical protein